MIWGCNAESWWGRGWRGEGGQGVGYRKLSLHPPRIPWSHPSCEIKLGKDYFDNISQTGSIYLSIYPIYLSVYLSIYLIYLSICLSIYLSKKKIKQRVGFCSNARMFRSWSLIIFIRFLLEIKFSMYHLHSNLSERKWHSFVTVKNHKLFLLFFIIFKRGGIKWKLLHTKKTAFYKGMHDFC